MDLQIEHQEKNGTRQLSVSGEVDAYTAPQLRKELLPLVEHAGTTVSVDLSDVQYMDSTGLGVFVAALKSSKKNGSTLNLRGMNPRVKRLFDITGLAEFMMIDREEKGGTS
ncbi:MAG TPA: STAS domain-containing protein [Bacillales bacterium]|nr:STAS domain-containing protein [Bacillales bacterium]